MKVLPFYTLQVWGNSKDFRTPQLPSIPPSAHLPPRTCISWTHWAIRERERFSELSNSPPTALTHSAAISDRITLLCTFTLELTFCSLPSFLSLSPPVSLSVSPLPLPFNGIWCREATKEWRRVLKCYFAASCQGVKSSSLPPVRQTPGFPWIHNIHCLKPYLYTWKTNSVSLSGTFHNICMPLCLSTSLSLFSPSHCPSPSVLNMYHSKHGPKTSFLLKLSLSIHPSLSLFPLSLGILHVKYAPSIYLPT